MITCILLAAGLSERFGSPKALACLAPKTTVLQHLLTILLQSACDEIVVVLGANASSIEPTIVIQSRIRVVYNKHYNFGQTSSLQTGWQAVDSASKGIMFLPVDCPLVKASSIDDIIHSFKNNSPDVLIPSYKNKKGHPPIFHQRLTPSVLNIPTSQGINSLFTQYPVQTIAINDPGIVQSFNTLEEFESIKAAISKQ